MTPASIQFPMGSVKYNEPVYPCIVWHCNSVEWRCQNL
nr:MAG TPA: hypothetical protein [Bacteriophage sp.]